MPVNFISLILPLIFLSSTLWTCILLSGVIVVIKHGSTRRALVSTGIGIVPLRIFIVKIATTLAVALPELRLQFSDDTINPFKWNRGWLGQLLRIKREAGLRSRLICYCMLVASLGGTVIVLVVHSFLHSILFPYHFRIESLLLFPIVLSTSLNCL